MSWVDWHLSILPNVARWLKRLAGGSVCLLIGCSLP